MRLLRAHTTAPLISLSPAALDCLERGEAPGEGYLTAGTSKDGLFGWLCRGPSLEVFSTSTGARVAAWTFGAILRDAATSITATAELPYEGSLRLLVATTTPSNTTGLLSVFDIHRSVVLKAIELPYKVTAVECVSGAGADQALGPLIGKELQSFCGVVAVGTAMGHVYLLDLCLDNEEDNSDEVRPNNVLYLEASTRDVATLRLHTMAKRMHLCLELDEGSNCRGYFYFRKADGSIIKTFAADDVFVTTLSFIKQTGTLAVGLSFGCFQLWRLAKPVLEYSSRLEDDLAPVLGFAYQEPENDPRSFCYLWVARGPLPQDSVEDFCSSIMLFQLGYNNKSWHESRGYIYEELTSVCCRFEHDLTANPYLGTNTEGLGSRMVSCYTLRDPAYHVPERSDEDSDIFDEGCGGEDLSLCVFAWEAAAADAHSKPAHHLAIFDMNRWYQAQMPFSVRPTGSGNELCPYFAFFTLEESAEAVSPDNLMAVCIDYRSLTRFLSCVLPPPEQHYYPASLAFDLCCIGETGLVHSKILGAQRQLLADLQQRGAESLLEPSGLYNMCLYAGLLPRNMEIASANLPTAQKREALLSTALDNDLLQFIMACINTAAAADHADGGYSLRFLLEWAWGRVGQVKDSIDKLCEPLYDWSGSLLDTQTTQVLRHQQTLLIHLQSIFQALGAHTLPMTEQGRHDLELKQQVTELISAHLNAVLWFYTVGLLPEHAEDDMASEGRYSYPARALMQMYTKRRQEINALHSVVHGTDILLIDGMLEQMGDSARLVLERDGGTGLYPPNSLHTVLTLYLSEGVATRTKQLLVAYLLFDMMHVAPEDQTTMFSNRLQAFSQAFGLTHSQTRLIQGMWLLDHKEYEDSLLFLLDPMVRSELAPWQNTRIIKAFLYQSKHRLALKFYRIRKPPALSPEDVKLKLTVLLANGLTSEAFEYQQLSRDELSAEDLLSHLFLGCQQTKTVDALLQLPLSEEEESHLVEYLKTTQEAGARELLVMYYLQRSRFIEAIRLNGRLKQSMKSELDAAARDRAATRNAIVDCYHSVLPRVQRRLALEMETAPKRALLARREVVRPTPLSAMVQRAQRSTVVSHASLIQAVLENVKEVKTTAQSPWQPSHSIEEESSAPGPFICTPITPRVKRRVSHASEIIFPTEQLPEANSSKLNTPKLQPGMSPQKSCLQSPFSSTALDFMVTGTAKKRMSRFFGAEALSLLQTPPVRRKSPTRSRPSTQPSTPHSILKPRHRPPSAAPSPLPDTSKSTSAPRNLTPPRIPRLTDLVKDSPVRTPVGLDSSTLGTPKQLRFNMPTASPDDVSPLVEEAGPAAEECESPLRSVRDRSPTPERSPKHSPGLDMVSDAMPSSDSVAMETNEHAEEEVLVVDHDITFNLNKSHASDGANSAAMETSHDTEPLVGIGAAEPDTSEAAPYSSSQGAPCMSWQATTEADVVTSEEVTSEEDLQKNEVSASDSETDNAHMNVVVSERHSEVEIVQTEKSVVSEKVFVHSSRQEVTITNSTYGDPPMSLPDSSSHSGVEERLTLPLPPSDSESDEAHSDNRKCLFNRTKDLRTNVHSQILDSVDSSHPVTAGLEASIGTSLGLPRVDSDLDRYSTVVNVDSESECTHDINLDDVELDVDFTVPEEPLVAEPGTSGCPSLQAEVPAQTLESDVTEDSDMPVLQLETSHNAPDSQSNCDAEPDISDVPLEGFNNEVQSSNVHMDGGESDIADEPAEASMAPLVADADIPQMDADMTEEFHNTTASFLSYQWKRPEPRVTRRTSVRLVKAAEEGQGAVHQGPGGDQSKQSDDKGELEQLAQTASSRRTSRGRPKQVRQDVEQTEPFKTPPRPSRLATMPPTPPESLGKASPTNEPSPQPLEKSVNDEGSAQSLTTRRQTTRSSRSRSPKEDSVDGGENSKMVDHKLRTSPTRTHRSPHRCDCDLPETKTEQKTRKAKCAVHGSVEQDRTPNTTPDVSPATSPARTPTRRNKKPVEKATTPAVAVTPTRRGRKSIQTAAETNPITPNRRGRKTSIQVEEAVEVAVEPEVGTPPRRGRKSTPKTDVTEENSTVQSGPVTPRRGRKTEERAVTPRRTPNRRCKKDEGTDAALVEGEQEVLTPSRRSTRRSVLQDKPATPVKEARGRKKLDVEESMDAEGSQMETKDQAPSAEGPLSEGSFMMNLRGRRSLSRDTTPAEENLPATETQEEEDTVEPFTFSDPKHVGSVEESQFVDGSQFVDAATAAPSFLFSPPLTRQRKVRQSLSSVPDSQLTSAADVRQSLPGRAAMPSILPSLLPERATNAAPFFIKETRAKRAKKTKPDSPEMIVNLLPSPTPEELEEASKHPQPARSKVKRSSSMTLRPKRYTSTKKKPLKLW